MAFQTYGVTQLTNTYRSPIFNNRAPLASDHKYDIGQIWIYKISSTQSNYYFLAGLEGNIATWSLLGGPGTFPITPYVVGPTGQAGFQTIQAALNAANAAGGGIVYIQPGTYTENLTLFGNTELVGTPGNSDSGTPSNCTIIVGVHTPPNTGSFTAVNIKFQNASDIFASNAAGSAALVLENVFIAVTNGFLFNLPNWTGALVVYNLGSGSTNDGVVNNSGGAFVFFVSATLGAGIGQTMVTSGTVILQEIDLNCPWNAATGTTIASDYVIFTHTVTAANNSTGSFKYCTFNTDATAALTMSSSQSINLLQSIINSSSNPSIAGVGAGVLTIGDVTFLNNAAISSSLTILYAFNSNAPVTPYVVGSVGKGNYQTIQSAVNAANVAGGGIVVVQPGTYTENLTLFNAVHIMGLQFADAGGGVNIIGQHIPPASGGFAIQYVSLSTATNIFSSNVAGSAHIVLGNALVNVTNGYTFNLPNWTGKLESFDVNAAVGTNDGYINNTGGSEVDIFECSVGSGTTNVMTISGFNLFAGANVYCPINFVTGASAQVDYSDFNKAITFSNNSTGKFATCTIRTGAAAAITMSSSAAWNISLCTIDSSNNPAIAGAGAGTLSYQGLTFLSNALFAGTLTLSGSSLTGTVNTALAGGTLSIKSTSANPGNNAGFLQCSINGAVAYIPYFTNIAP